MLIVIPLFIGTSELLLIAALVLFLFGGKKLPELMRGMGQGVKAFKEGMNIETDESAIKQSEEKSNDADESKRGQSNPDNGQQTA